MRTNTDMMITRRTKKAAGILLIAMICLIQAVGAMLIGVGMVVLKSVSTLMVTAGIILFATGSLSGSNLLSVILVSVLLFWLPDLMKLVLIGLAFLQGKIADITF